MVAAIRITPRESRCGGPTPEIAAACGACLARFCDADISSRQGIEAPATTVGVAAYP